MERGEGEELGKCEGALLDGQVKPQSLFPPLSSSFQQPIPLKIDQAKQQLKSG